MTLDDEAEEPKPMATEGLFDLRTPEHLLHMLDWEYAQWQKDPLNTYVAWNFFVTAEHLFDWLRHTNSQPLEGLKPPAFKKPPPPAHLLAPGEWRQALQA